MVMQRKPAELNPNSPRQSSNSTTESTTLNSTSPRSGFHGGLLNRCNSYCIHRQNISYTSAGTRPDNQTTGTSTPNVPQQPIQAPLSAARHTDLIALTKRIAALEKDIKTWEIGYVSLDRKRTVHSYTRQIYLLALVGYLVIAKETDGRMTGLVVRAFVTV